MSEASTLIRAERQRQIDKEGWTYQHDAEHTDGALLSAAVVYLQFGTDKAGPVNKSGIPVTWPWEDEWFKPKDRVSNLVRAGALCLAEDNRLNAAMIDTRPKIFEAPWAPQVREVYDEVVSELEKLVG
ncbi:hypothetical protein [Rhizobium sp. MHM7A]|uniref:hypothetical protein n=1 Tax=Rhizobium sp. MHM7A TaxID=2583233 RepID=UPI0011069840|nr:hypothetical protein [Rhizobium sp. MHM7A]TLX16733.1 hypothetical protein FFR93_05160 [Rhizobium sp. MHM7A]